MFFKSACIANKLRCKTSLSAFIVKKLNFFLNVREVVKGNSEN